MLRKIRRNKVKAQRKNKNVEFRDLWRYEQIAHYGEEEYIKIINKNKMYKILQERAKR